jgi:RND family efflux transporter MFP subunit
MKSVFKLQSGALAVLILLNSCKQKAAEKVFSDDTIPVKVVSLQSLQNPSEVLATGLITTANQANYAFKIGGIISKIYVQEGASFKKGQLLAILNPTEIGSGLEQSRLGVEKAKRDYTRALSLYKDSVATLEQLQNAKTALDIAQKSEDAVAFNAQYSKIYAQSDGFVAKKMANEGEVISPGTPVLATNENSGLTNWTVKLGVTDKEWAAVTVGQNADVNIDAFPNKVFHATVFRKSQASDQTSGSFEVELKLLLSGVKPALGMFAKANIKTGEKQMFTPVPYEALVEADGKSGYVFVPNGSDRVRRIPVVIERFDDQQAFVKSGLEGIHNIIVSNSAFLNEKSTIKIIK